MAVDDIFRDRVRERDLDNFLVEEIFAVPDFLDWVVAKAGPGFTAPDGLTVLLQKSPPRENDRRQTDVRIGWFDGNEELCACILIESKVTADFQPGQAQAYAAELAALRARLGAASAAALLVAPAAKLTALTYDGCFDGEISIEDVIGHLQARSQGDVGEEVCRRLLARVQLLEALCGKRSGTAWVGSTVAEKRDFAQSYADLAAKILPDLRVRPSTDGPKAITRLFEGLEINGLPPIALRHEFGSAPGWKYANLQFKGAVDHLASLRSSGILADTPYSATEAGKSLAVRVQTPAVDPMRPFSEERGAVEQGLLAIRELVVWLKASAAALGDLFSASGGSPRVIPTEAAFAEELMETYRQCERIGYRPTGMLQMLGEHGAIDTARRLMAAPPSEGFHRLALLNRLDLAIESIALREPWRALFTDQELAKAERRLRR
ncbi:hypothetical protein [Sphingobium sp. B2]|uniref:hypothetical protein n=2 Tax=Sphingobium sp. B2 TaxID=2583228 RepID=UPI0011A9C4D4|nr:hypothetical protein [Sphingobium sp. B2]